MAYIFSRIFLLLWNHCFLSCQRSREKLSLVQTGDKKLVTSPCSFILLACRGDKKNGDETTGDKTRWFTRETRKSCLVPSLLISCRQNGRQAKVGDKKKVLVAVLSFAISSAHLFGPRPFDLGVIFRTPHELDISFQ